METCIIGGCDKAGEYPAPPKEAGENFYLCKQHHDENVIHPYWITGNSPKDGNRPNPELIGPYETYNEAEKEADRYKTIFVGMNVREYDVHGMPRELYPISIIKMETLKEI